MTVEFGKFYDRAGQQISLIEWGEHFSDFDYKSVGYAELPDGTTVSTVWVGINHGFPFGVPYIFETMVFPSPSSRLEQDVWHYPTEAAALAGHDQVVANLTEALDRLRKACEEIDWKGTAS